MNGKINQSDFEFAVYAINDLIKDDTKREVDFSSTSLSPSNVMFVLNQLGIKPLGQITTENYEDFLVEYEGGLVLWYNALLFTMILMKGSNYNGTIQDTKKKGN